MKISSYDDGVDHNAEKEEENTGINEVEIFLKVGLQICIPPDLRMKIIKQFCR